MAIWNWFVVQLEQVLLYFQGLTGSSGLAIILFTVIARLIIFPITLTSIKSTRRMQELQPLLKEAQRKYGKDQQKYTEETMRLYKEHKVNPAGGCLPMLLQFPIFIGVYQAVINLTRVPVSEHAAQAMVSVLGSAGVNVAASAAAFQQNLLGGQFLWLRDLGQPDSFYILPVLSVAFQLVVQLMATPRVQDPQQKAMMQSMLLLPIVFGYIGFTFPSGAVLYWVTGSVLSALQQYVVSGWGSLANYLKFLPADFNGLLPTTVPAAAAAPSSAPAITSAAPSTAAASDSGPKLGFWDVLRPLTEQEAVAGASAGDSFDDDSSAGMAASETRRRMGPTSPRRRKPRR